MRNSGIVVAVIGCLILNTTGARGAGGALDDGRKVEQKAVEYLLKLQQADGSFHAMSDREPPALTAMVLKALVQDGKHGSDPAAAKAVKYLLSIQKADGGFYKDSLATYNTAIIISGLAATKDPALKEPIAKGIGYLKASQWGAGTIAGPRGEKIDPNGPTFGGWAYGGGPRGGRPDVSNTGIALDALRDSGLKPEDPAYQNALKFITKMQNRSESNPSAWAGDDGGLVYSPGRNDTGESPAGEYNDAAGHRRLRSYGSMTYAGLKSMIYAGLSKDDPRVKAAWEWVNKNWTVDKHAGMGEAGPQADPNDGVYYYYDALARALNAYGEPTITDAKGTPHDWRVELIHKLAALQKEDGSFVGTDKWMEVDPIIATCLATAALQDAIQDLSEHPAK